MTRFFISDYHFNHYAISLKEYGDRPFKYELLYINPYNQLSLNTKVLTHDGNEELLEKWKNKPLGLYHNEILIEHELIKNENLNNFIFNASLQIQLKAISVKEMNEHLIEKWNNKVSKNDTVYFVGDFGYGSITELKEIYNRLNGKKILIKGNHDIKTVAKPSFGFDEVHDFLEIKIEEHDVLLSHYPYLSPRLSRLASSRPNIIKFVKDENKFTQIPEHMNYDEELAFLEKRSWHELNLYSEPSINQEHFNKLKSIISRHIGTRLCNEGKILICGHTHSHKKRNKNMINVCCEAWDFEPASESQILELIKDFYVELEQINKDNYENYEYYSIAYSNSTNKKNNRFKDISSIFSLYEKLKTHSLNEDEDRINIPQDYSQKWYKTATDLNFFIPKQKLIDGKFYKGTCRNARWAYYHNGFFHYVRTKFSSVFIEKINCIEDDNGYDLFVPIELYEPTEEELKKFFELY